MRQGLDIRIGQTLSMTPQLQQAIRLLQLSAIELQEEIQQALEENPLLELQENSDESGPEDSAGPAAADRELDADPVADLNADADYPEPDTALSSDIPDDLNLDADWGEVYDLRTAGASDGDADNQGFLENQGEGEEDLQAHLLWQVRMSNLGDTDRQVAEAIVLSLDNAGYLVDSLTDIRAGLPPEYELEPEAITAVLKYIQSLDPAGVGARDLRECLLLQLRRLPESVLQLKTLRLVDQHLDLLEKRDYKELKKRLKMDQDTLEAAITLLRTLDPKPGSRYSGARTDYITPDVYVRKFRGEWVVSLNQQLSPQLLVNQHYADLIGKVRGSADNQYLKNNLQQARWLIRSLESRNSTILSVAKTIVDRQRAFMQYGEQAMKPLILRDIAEELDMHESTISRVTTNKYMLTPRGIFEFKYFFSSQLETDTGSGCSSTAIRAMIRQLITAENSRSPLSDSQLTRLLKAEGINVARRTVAKYRESMDIPASHDRKSLVTS
ncbi:MAG: RNA polymerase factor sigma-54 [Thiothrix sp.]|nr:RNA polymerase factor sigma-54 [Thiothrix sp.]